LVKEILDKKSLSREDIIALLNASGNDKVLLFKKAAEIKARVTGKKAYFRGLIELSNICSKNCYYCGIRKSNRELKRYRLTDTEVLDAARYAYEHNFGSIVIQSGEVSSTEFTDRIENLITRIKKLSSGTLGITLSLGEQEESVYQKWFDAGAHRYLLRIETSNRQLYRKIHPDDNLHSFENREGCLRTIKKTGFQTGTGVMIGLPFQTVEDLADDLLFMRTVDVDMVGMGPYIEHNNTPLYKYRKLLLPAGERLELSLKMIAILRILMKDINIAAATALQAIDPHGREKALQVGANVIMPNITPGTYRNDYNLYEHKPTVSEHFKYSNNYPDSMIQIDHSEIGFGEWGDSKHFFKRTGKK